MPAGIDYSKIAGKLGKELSFVQETYGSAGLVYRILFSKRGYTPHYAEHLIDPLTGREILFMCDPHTRRSAFIYDVEKREIVWEFRVPGTTRNNPHQGFILPYDVEGFGNRGDVVVPDGDNNIIVIDRFSKKIKFREKITAWSPNWLHCVYRSVERGYIIATDWGSNYFGKFRAYDLKNVWNVWTPKPSKISIIEPTVDHPHGVGHGGNYLIVENLQTKDATIDEVRDGDGSYAYRFKPFMSSNPHSAFYMGRVEAKGNVIVVGSEGHGGITAYDDGGNPVFGIMGVSHTYGGLKYGFNQWGLAQVTHVFPTLSGRIGFISWSGYNSAVVGEILKFPDHQVMSWIPYWTGVPALNQSSRDDWMDFLLPVAGAVSVMVMIYNRGPNSLDYEVDGYLLDRVDPYGSYGGDPELGRVPIDSGSLASGSRWVKQFYPNHYTAIYVKVKSTTAGASTKYDIIASKVVW